MSSYTRTVHPSDVRMHKELEKKAQQLPSLNINSPEFKNLEKTNKSAYFLNLGVQALFLGVAKDEDNIIKIATIELLKQTSALTQMSVQSNFRLSKIQIANFYGISDGIHMTLSNWKQLGKQDWLLRLYKYDLDHFLTKIIDSIAVATAIADKRVVFLNQEFAITYGVNKLESGKIVYGHLFASVIDSNGLWSFDKDDAVRIKVSTLRAAKKAVTAWRGASLIGEVTHSDAQKLSDFLGLVPVANNSKCTQVMLRGKSIFRLFGTKNL